MKKLFAGALVAIAVAFAVGLSPSPAQPLEIDDAAVNAKVDARLRQVLTGLLRAQNEQAHVVR